MVRQKSRPPDTTTCTEDNSSISQVDSTDEDESQPESKYPYIPLLFLLTTTVGQRSVLHALFSAGSKSYFSCFLYSSWFSYSATGLQAVLELYFLWFLFICAGKRKSLSTAGVNVFIAIYQLCALTAGFLADKIIGKSYLSYVETSWVWTNFHKEAREGKWAHYLKYCNLIWL